MNTSQQNRWFRIALLLAWAAFFGCLSFLTLLALPAAANNQLPARSREVMQLAPAGTFTVAGIVRDQFGTQVEDVVVFAFSGSDSVETLTNETGQYSLTLNTGNFYNIAFHPPVTTGLASQIRRGINTTQILNVTLPSGDTISGTVYRDATKTTSVANVAIFAFSRDTFDGFGLPTSHSDGTYQISLESGTWDLTFTPPAFTGLGPVQTTVTLTEDITKDIILQSGFTVYGQVITGGGGGQANVEIFAQDPSQPNGYGFAPTDAGGFYTGTLPAGTFDIEFLAPPFLGLGSTVVTSITGPPDVELNLTLPAGHTVSGTVKCDGGLANAFVFAAPEPPLSAGFFGGWGRFAGADGFYVLALQPGTYTFIVEPPEGSALPTLTMPMVEVRQDLTLDFDYHCGETPTVITLVSFETIATEAEVRLIWETASEIDNAGFNLYRATLPGGPWAKINPSLIDAQGDAVSGARYVYTDTNVVKGTTYYYLLEDVDIYGVSTFHGPVTAMASPLNQLYLPLILKQE